MVTLFLFYSGYGVYESIKKKKSAYVSTIPKKRIFKTLFNFDIAVLSFLILNIILKRSYPIKNIVLSFVGWEGIGNSNWYIFGVLIMYTITYLSFKLFDKDDKKSIKLIWILSLVFILFMNVYKDDYWFNTLLCFSLGLSYSYHKKDIEKLILGDNKKYTIVLVLSIITFLILKKYQNQGYMYYELLSMSFVITFILATMKINFNSPILKWFGDNLFWVYILQRIPMLTLKNFGYVGHPYRFALLSFIVTIVLTIIYKFLSDNLWLLFDRKLENKNEKKD